MQRRRFVERLFGFAGIAAIGQVVATSILPSSLFRGYVQKITHEVADGEAFSNQIPNWINLENFLKLNDEFYSSGLLKKYEHRIERHCASYEWVFKDKAACESYRARLYSPDIFYYAAFANAGVQARRETLTVLV